MKITRFKNSQSLDTELQVLINVKKSKMAPED